MNNPSSIPPYGSGTVYQNGTISTNQGCALLPLNVQPNTVYILSASITIPSSMGTEVEMGFTVTNTSQFAFTNIGNCRFNDSPPNGYAWDYVKVGQNSEFFAGSKTGGGSTAGGDRTPSAGTYNFVTILSTLNNTNAFSITNVLGHGATNCWVASSFINGNQVGTNCLYPGTATGAPGISLGYCGIGSAGFAIGGNPSGIQWNYFAVSSPLLPVITQQPASGSANENAAYTNTVIALVDTNGGPLAYQWYTNGVPILNATNASLVINPVLTSSAGNNYYVVLTNTYGAVTSSPASLIVYGSPAFITADPITYTNLMTLYGGTNNGVTTYLGSSPQFSVMASGAAPITYQWLTNGMAVGGATSTTFSYTNCQLNSPTNFACIASNYLGTVTNQWAVQYIPATTAPYPQAVLAAGAVGYWRLNEINSDVNQYNNGQVCDDYISGNNGIYTNTALYQPGYSASTDPSETSAQFGPYDASTSCDANSIGTNVDFSTSSNAEFTVSVWANGGYGYGGTEPAPGGIVSKGYFNGEEFSLDDGAPGSDARFEVRNAAGTAANANSTVQLGGNDSWNYLVGVCDESNGLVSLYINGALAGQASITPGSGVEPDSLIPIMIGARSTSASSYGDNQFDGALDDVAIFNHAFSASQVAALYQASGNTIIPYVLLLSPLPPTNVVFQTNTTVTLSATAYGTPPFGYYWTNVTTGGILASGTTNALGSLNATLTIPNIPASLDGAELELVVTNASASTNWFINLFAETAPLASQTLSYSNSLVYSNSFPATTEPQTINGLPATAANFLVGGSNVTWICTYTNNAASNGTVYANGTLGTNAGNALVPFTPEPGYIYTMTGTIIIPSAQGDWVSMGFAQSAAQSGTPGTGRFTDSPINGYAWMYLQSPNAFFEPGPRTSGTSSEVSSVSTSYPVTNTLQIVLNTVTNNAWIASAYINGTAIGTNYYNSSLPIAYAGIGQNAFPGSEQWVSWTISQVAPGGVPPYVLAPLPSTNTVVLTNATITIPATGFGSAVLGYYWINNSTILASGTTNNMAPLPANLSIASTSLSPGELELVLTNAYGTNITIIPLVSAVPTNPPVIGWGITNGNLYLSWSNSYTSYYQLQAETNSMSIGLTNDWVNVGGSSTTNMFVFPINLTNGSVFYRLITVP